MIYCQLQSLVGSLTSAVAIAAEVRIIDFLPIVTAESRDIGSISVREKEPKKKTFEQDDFGSQGAGGMAWWSVGLCSRPM